MNPTKFNKNHILAQQILEKMGNSDEFLEEVQTESKPSRINNRRVREERHRVKQKKRSSFEDWND